MAFRTTRALTLAVPLVLAVAFALAATLPAWSAASQDDSAQRAALFAELAEAGSEPEAREIEARIWALWLKAPDPESQDLLKESNEAQLRFDYHGALDALGKLIERAPGYAEGWNQRAFVLFLMGAYDASLEAIEETLKREPRHYGALAGKGVILLMQGQDARGQAALHEAIAINPWLKERSLITDLPGRKI